MKLSCGFIVKDCITNKILGCHPFKNKHYCDVPKGCIEVGEGPIECAIRELKEETGIIFNNEEYIDFGEMKYLCNKNIHLFYFSTKIDLNKLHCESLIDKGPKKGNPEMSGFELINMEDINSSFNKSLVPVLNNCFNKIKEHIICKQS